MLKNKQFFTPSGDSEASCLRKLNQIAKKRSYQEPQVQGSYIVMKKKATEGFNVGDVRISFVKSKCGPLSLISQQVQDNDQVFTFREYNSVNKEAKMGEETAPESTQGLFGFRNGI
jgi:hypothetical protein